MRLLVIPPLVDPTSEPAVPPEVSIVDANRALLSRLTGAEFLAGLAERLDTPGTSAAHAVAVRAAMQVLDAPDATGLRALGAVLRAASLDDPAVRLTVDDLELVTGTTECGRDVEAAAEGATLFAPELSDAAEAVRAAGHAHVVVDGDQQLPAAVRLAQLVGANRLTLCGRFARRYREPLAALPSLAGACFSGDVLARRVRWRGAADLAAGAPRPGQAPVGSIGPATAPRWVTEPAEVPAGGPWIGWLDAADAAGLASAALDRCRGLTLTVAALPGFDRAIGHSGQTADLRPVINRVAERAPLAVELVVGAPGVCREAVEHAAHLVAAGAGAGPLATAAARLAGFRPFRLPRTHRGPWHGYPLRLADPPAGHDLARWRGFAADRTMTAAQALDAVHELVRSTTEASDHFPGRLATAVVAGTRWRDLGRGHCWDPAAQLVEVHCGPDGRGPGTFLASLRTGRLLRVDDRFAALLRRLRTGGPPAAAVLDKLPADRRADLLARLRSAGVVRGPR